LIDILMGFGLPAFLRDHVYVVTQKRVRIRVSAWLSAWMCRFGPVRRICRRACLQAFCVASPGIRL